AHTRSLIFFRNSGHTLLLLYCHQGQLKTTSTTSTCTTPGLATAGRSGTTTITANAKGQIENSSISSF
ncbi:hypothetical protein TYRP_011756, partial [Tyrophagus putrescentiae]